MKKALLRILSIFLAITMMIYIAPMSAFALSPQEQEDIYRVDSLWQDEFNQQNINWLLESDNFLYHLDITTGSIIHDASYEGLNLDPIERKENFADILTAIIDYSYENVRQESAQESANALTSYFFDSFEEYLLKQPGELKQTIETICDATNLASIQCLDYLYLLDSDEMQLGYEKMLEYINLNIDHNTLPAGADNYFEAYVTSSDWLEKWNSYSTMLSVVGESINIITDAFDIAVELESYQKTDKKFVELLKYIHSVTTDSALKAACQEVYTKLSGNYEDTFVAEFVKRVVNGGFNVGLEILKNCAADANIYARCIKLGYDAGTLVSNWFYNTNDIKKHMQSIYCLNKVTEIIVPALQNELSNLHYYDSPGEFAASYAADTIYHMKALICLRRLGEESYYNLKDSAYSSFMVKAVDKLPWVSSKEDQQVIENWYKQFLSVIDNVEGFLYKMIPTYHYYKKPEPAKFEKEGSRLVSYNGDSVNVYIPSDAFCNTIDSYAFNRNETIESVDIPYTIKTIKSYAFNNCTNLKYITINSFDAVIEDNAFYNCNEDLIIYGYANSTAQNYAIANDIDFIPLNNDYQNSQDYTDSDFVIENGVLVEYRGDGGDVYIPEGVTKVGKYAFNGNSWKIIDISTLHIPKTVLSIENFAFEYCNINTLIIYDSIQEIGSSAFDYGNGYGINELRIGEGSVELTYRMIPAVYGIDTLSLPKSLKTIESGFTTVHYSAYGYTIDKKIYVNSENPYYSSVDGILYNKEKTSLLLCPAEIENDINIPETVKKIEKYAFAQCDITSLNLPYSIIDIPYEAFFHTYIDELIYNANISLEFYGNNNSWNGTSPFENCEINTLKIGNSAKIIPNFMFKEVSIETITLGDNLEKIGKEAFAYCIAENIIIPESVIFLGDYAFESSTIQSLEYNAIEATTEYSPFGGAVINNIIIGKDVTVIPDYIFSACSGVKTILLPNGLKRIGTDAFAGCNDLEEFTIPETVTEIGGGAFAECSLLKSLIIPQNVTSIGGGVIYGCNNLKSLTYNAKNAVGSYSFQSDYVTELKIGENVEKLDDYIFSGMSALKTVVWNAVNAGEGPFFNMISAEETNVEKIVIGKNVKELPRAVFYMTENAFTSVTTIEYNAIDCNEWGWDEESYLPNLDRIIIGNEVESLPDGFLCDSTVETVVIPENVKSLGRLGLSNSEYLKEVTILNKDFDLSYGCFEDCPNLTIYSYASNRSLVYRCEELKIPFIAFCEHSNFSSNIIVEPSCTEQGTIQYVCSDCGYTYEEVLSNKHNYSTEWTIDIPSTCTTVGSKSRHCLDCDEKTEITEIPASHTYQAVTIDPTCTQNGSITYTCEICSDSYSEVLLSAHIWSDEWTVDVEPTETTEGSKSRHCIRCDAMTDVTSIPTLSTESPVADFAYSIRNNEVTIDSYIGTSGIMNIPTYIEGYPVTSIAAFAFYNNSTITKASIPYTVTDMKYYAFCDCPNLLEITIENGITEIPQSAFSGCSSLEVVNLPEGIVTIGNGAFYRCTKLTEINIPNTTTSIGDIAFYNCTALSRINIPDATVSIGEDAFCGTPWFDALSGDCVIMGDGILMRFQNEFGDDITIPEGVKSVYGDFTGGAFENSYAGVVYIPSTLTNWSQSALQLDTLSFVVDENNPFLCALDDVLYDLDKTRLKAVPSRKKGSICLPETVQYIEASAFASSNLDEAVLNDGLLEIGDDAFYFADVKINIPDTVTTIGENAFCYNRAITEIVIPSGVTKLESWTFSGCSSLQKITLPENLTEIDSYAFYNCTALTDVYYLGTEENRNNIYIGSSNAPLTNAQWHYYSVNCGDANNDGEISALDLAEIRIILLSSSSNSKYNECYDTNGDGEINLIDLVRLKKYLAGYDVPLGTENTETQTTEVILQPAYSEKYNIVT